MLFDKFNKAFWANQQNVDNAEMVIAERKAQTQAAAKVEVMDPEPTSAMKKAMLDEIRGKINSSMGVPESALMEGIDHGRTK